MILSLGSTCTDEIEGIVAMHAASRASAVGVPYDNSARREAFRREKGTPR